MFNKRIIFLSVLLMFVFSLICFAESIPTTSNIDDVRDNNTIIEFRGCLRGNTQIIRDLYQEIDAKAYVLGVEYVASINGPSYGGESFLKYRFIGEGRKIKILRKETIEKFLSKHSKNNLEEVK